MSKTKDFLVIKSDKRTTATNRPYYRLLMRKEGGEEVTANIWEKNIAEEPKRGDIICAFYTEELYEGKTQLNIEKYSIRLDYPKDKFKQSPIVDQDKVFKKLYLNSWFNLDIDKLFKNLLQYLQKENLIYSVKEAPAASRNHHNRRAGLLQHMEEMWDFAEVICSRPPTGMLITDAYVSGPRHFEGLVDLEIVKAAILFHDLGKIKEYDLDTGESDQDRELAYMGHVSWGAIILAQCWPEGGNSELRNKLIHCVLSHHGRIEHAAALQPRIPEATVLHLVDLLSAQLDIHRTASKLPQGQRPEFSKTLFETTPITTSWPVK